jgi:dTDP-4-amino-4,6-dideoxygalactose transaminase
MIEEPVPFLDLVGLHRELEVELLDAAREAIRSARFVGGPAVDAFEREFAAYSGAAHCVGVASGTDAVRFALMASGVEPGDAVITVAHTFIATVEGISQAGAATEFVDIDDQTCTMSPESLDRYLTGCQPDPVSGRPLGRRSGKPITAILPVHLYGLVADMAPLTEIATRHGLVVIEDACQAHGAEYRSRTLSGRAGALGKAGAFSFYPGKNLGACGEAGAVTTNDPAVAQQVRTLRDHGQAQKYYHQMEGYNGRLDALQAAFLRIKLRRLDAWNADRRAAARRYHNLLTPLAEAGGLMLPHDPDWCMPVYHLYVIRVRTRDALAGALHDRGIHTGFHYPVPLHRQDCYRGLGYAEGSLPVTERVAAEVISLPMFPGLTAHQQARVAAAMEASLAAGIRS